MKVLCVAYGESVNGMGPDAEVTAQYTFATVTPDDGGMPYPTGQFSLPEDEGDFEVGVWYEVGFTTIEPPNQKLPPPPLEPSEAEDDDGA